MKESRRRGWIAAERVGGGSVNEEEPEKGEVAG